MTPKNTSVWVALIAVGIIAIAGLFMAIGGHDSVAPAGGVTSCNGGNCTNFSAVDTSGGYFINGVSILSSARVAALGATTITGNFTQAPTAIATTTTGGNSATLSQANLLSGQYWTVNVNQASNFTYTLPATSTLTTFLPNTGNSTQICFTNATTAAISLVFAAGTGIDLESSTSSLKMLPTTTGCISFIRKANTDVEAIFTPNADAD